MNKTLLKIIKWIVAATIIFFLIKYLLDNFNQIPKGEITFNYSLLIISIIIITISYLLMSFLWWLTLKKMNKKISFSKSFRIYFSSMLGRYVPGKALLVISRIYMTQKQGIERKEAFASIVLDLALFSLSGIILFLFTLPFFEIIPKEIIWPLFVAGILLLPLVHPKLLKKIINLGLKIIKKQPIRFRMKFKNSFTLLLLHILRWIIQGIGMYLFAKSFLPTSPLLIYIIPGVYALSIVLGMLMIIAPGGLGIREGLIVLLLAPFMPTTLIILFSLTSRILLTLIEIVLAIIFEIKLLKQQY